MVLINERFNSKTVLLRSPFLALLTLLPVVTSLTGYSPAFVQTKSSSLLHNVGRVSLLQEKRDHSSNNKNYYSSRMQLSMQTLDEETDTETTTSMMSVSSEMKLIGPYACMALRFPNLATQSQKERNVTGISLDFVLDTAANTNTLNAQVAKELELDIVGQALPGVGAGGEISGGDTFLLGDCQLEGYKMANVADDAMDGNQLTNEIPLFMSELTASALPIASPAGAGLLGSYFFNAFPGGVQFDWGSSRATIEEQKPPEPPMITFYGDRMGMEEEMESNGFTNRVPIQMLKGSNLPCITISINGVSIPALLDTGSPITVLNPAAAQLANVPTFELENNEEKEKTPSFFPFKNPLNQFQKNLKLSEAMARGDIVSLAGTDGRRIDLLRSKEPQQIGFENDANDSSMKDCRVYVGEIPGLEALDGLSVDGKSATKPAAIFGMDLIRSKRRMLYRSDEVYFSDK